MMSPHQRGYYRDNAILTAIEKHLVLNTEQIQFMFFRDIKNGQRIAQRRLQALYESKRVNRGRNSMYTPCYYYMGKKINQVEHTLAVNWIYVWFYNQLKTWEQITEFSREIDFKILRADAFIGIKNTISNKHKFYFIEADISDNPFDKVQKYNLLYESGKCLGLHWTKLTDRFPAIKIVTHSISRLKEIHKHIDQENYNGLEFKVMTFDKLKGDVVL